MMILPPVPALRSDHLARNAVCVQVNAENRRVGGKLSDAQNHAAAARAEEWVCDLFGIPFQGCLDRPDPGWDFLWAAMRVDVKWTPHRTGKLLIPAWKRDTAAEVFVGVFGPLDEAPEIGGWAFLWDFPDTVDSALPTPAYTIRRGDLRPIADLLAYGRDEEG